MKCALHRKVVVNSFSSSKKCQITQQIFPCVFALVLFYYFNARAVLFHMNVCICGCRHCCCCLCYFVFVVVVLMAPEDATVSVVAFFYIYTYISTIMIHILSTPLQSTQTKING